MSRKKGLRSLTSIQRKGLSRLFFLAKRRLYLLHHTPKTERAFDEHKKRAEEGMRENGAPGLHTFVKQKEISDQLLRESIAHSHILHQEPRSTKNKLEIDHIRRAVRDSFSIRRRLREKINPGIKFRRIEKRMGEIYKRLLEIETNGNPKKGEIGQLQAEFQQLKKEFE